MSPFVYAGMKAKYIKTGGSMLKNSIQQANNKETDVKKAAVAAFFL
ncbi:MULTISPECIES: hypothetical protein [unclassified Undibacterium]